MATKRELELRVENMELKEKVREMEDMLDTAAKMVLTLTADNCRMYKDAGTSPDGKHVAEEDECNCIMCQLSRVVEGLDK